MGKTVELLLNHYAGVTPTPSRQIKFVITEDCLSDYLRESEDERNIKDFMETYDSDESSIIYEYATDDARILSEETTYFNDEEAMCI